MDSLTPNTERNGVPEYPGRDPQTTPIKPESVESGQAEHTSTDSAAGFLEYTPPSSTDLKRGMGDLRLLSRSLREEWPISESLRTKGVAFCEAVLDNGPTVRDGLKAVDVLARLDNVNRGRERNAIESRQGEQRDEREYVRMLLQRAGLRQQTADVTANSAFKVNISVDSQVIEAKQDTPIESKVDTGSQADSCDSAAVG